MREGGTQEKKSKNGNETQIKRKAKNRPQGNIILSMIRFSPLPPPAQLIYFLFSTTRRFLSPSSSLHFLREKGQSAWKRVARGRGEFRNTRKFASRQISHTQRGFSSLSFCSTLFGRFLATTALAGVPLSVWVCDCLSRPFLNNKGCRKRVSGDFSSVKYSGKWETHTRREKRGWEERGVEKKEKKKVQRGCLYPRWGRFLSRGIVQAVLSRNGQILGNYVIFMYMTQLPVRKEGKRSHFYFLHCRTDTWHAHAFSFSKAGEKKKRRKKGPH